MGMEKLPLITRHAGRFLATVAIAMTISGCGEAKTTVKVGAHSFAVPSEAVRDNPGAGLIFALEPEAAGGRPTIVLVEDAADFCRRHPATTDTIRAVCGGGDGVDMLVDAYRAEDIEKIAAEESANQYSLWLKPAGGRPRTFLSACSQWPDQAGKCQPVVRVGDLVYSFDIPADEIGRLPLMARRIRAALKAWEA
ncbi:hypothetical protein [Sphingomonas crocodyli]|uniref:Uncharacterized protein n=1 Tax=Sphingomonas crocodyli TaxID=1979270 RepID=A0A437M9Q5_9SPHN|nr:hypothetical protein [Sphingomonas crocodyli]RVT94379.1 hypothetical protein EOD43_11205 [Sphingomonas crocodyli]